MPRPHADDYTDSIEAYLTLRGGRTNAIYLCLLLITVCGIGALPLVQVPVSVRARGIIRPQTERHEIRAPVSGFVESVSASDNQEVRAGAEIAQLKADGPGARSRLLQKQREAAEGEIASLEILLGRAAVAASDGLQGPRLAEELEGYLAEAESSSRQLARERLDLERSRELARRGLAPAREVEDGEARLHRIRSDSIALSARYRARWAGDLRQARTELERLSTEIEIGSLDRELSRITAPVAGTLEEITPVSPGSYVAAGTSLFVLSPASKSIAEVYLPVKDIGLIRAGGRSRILIDSFDHNVWGHLEGTISSISADHVVVGDIPMFVVEVTLSDTSLTTRSGVRATVGKGMTLQAQFEIAERTLWQLLRDDVDDWLNPPPRS